MNCLHLAENIILLRRKKGVTQDEIAAFLGVTKASVSKWETKQSYPDILLLPQIAAYFGVSIDDLLGYQPQMSEEQIQKCYLELAADFANLPFEAVMEKSRNIVKEYYSCYPLLMQIANLWINHYMLSPNQETQTSILKEMIDLCDRVSKNSKEVGLCSNAVELKATVNLLLGNPTDTIETLEPLFESKQLALQSDPVLIQAYRMTGDTTKAVFYSQITIYSYLLSLVSNSTGMMDLQMNDPEACESTIKRIRQVINAYDLDHLHPNTALQFHYETAVFYCTQGKPEPALEELSLFVNGCLTFLETGLSLHGDGYFTRIEEWFDRFTLKTEAPRSEKVVLDSLLPAMENPALSLLFPTASYQELKKKIDNRKRG